MAEAFKQLGQSLPAAATLTDLYVVPGATKAVVSSISCCNQGPGVALVRIAVAIAGAANALSQYRFYDRAVFPGKTFIATIGITLATTDVVRVYSDTGTVSFAADGVEVT